MNLPTHDAGNRYIGLIVRNLFGNETLNSVAGVRAAVEEGRHPIANNSLEPKNWPAPAKSGKEKLGP
jgi:hypothetical protein